MRTIVDYFRQVFCKHDWLIEEGKVSKKTDFETKDGWMVYMRCKKCGYHKSHWKF